MSSIRQVAEQAAERARVAAEQAAAQARDELAESGKTAVRDFLADPDGLELHVCVVDVRHGMVTVRDGDGTHLAVAVQDGQVWLVTHEPGDRIVKRGGPLDGLADLGRRLADA